MKKPDRRYVLVYFGVSLGFGVMMGLAFPLYAAFFVDFKSPVHHLVFVLGCMGAGILVGLVSFLIGQVTVLRVVRLLSTRLKNLSERDGDLSTDLELSSSDSIGRLAQQFNRFLEKLRGLLSDLVALTDQVRRVSSNVELSVTEAAESLENLATASAQVDQASRTQTSEMRSVAHEVSDLLERIEISHRNTEEIAADFFRFSQSMEANQQRIKMVAGEANATGRRADELSATGRQGRQALESLLRGVAGVAGRANEIQNIVQVILDIATQTNILAMNAAIEAAHAGDKGRGFSVVAGEIRKLAESSSAQAGQIQDLLGAITEAVQATLGQSKEIEALFSRLSGDIEQVRQSSQTIASQMALQQEGDQSLSDGLFHFTKFYYDLSEAMTTQSRRVGDVRGLLETIEQQSFEIERSMERAQQEFQRATSSQQRLRVGAEELGTIVETLTEQTRKFSLGKRLPPQPKIL